jgi:hypothetical protein
MTRLIAAGAVALCAGLLLSGCGGAEAPAPAAPVSENGDEGDEKGASALISAEDLEAVSLYFERKRTVISRCFNDAMDSGEVPDDVRALYLTVTVTVHPGGKARDVRFSDATVPSAGIEACVRDHIDRWTLPDVAQAFEYSHRYGFNAL